MNIPKYWHKATQNINKNGKNIQVSRYGWSDESYEHAHKHALDRCMEAEKEPVFNRQESKKQYDVLPIREEIITDFQDLNAKATINCYGATCLNVADVMILDIDNWDLAASFRETKPKRISLLVSVFIALIVAVITGVAGMPFMAMCFLSGIICWFLTSITMIINNKKEQQWFDGQGGYKGMLDKRLNSFLEIQPQFSFNLYQTPNGYRLIALQGIFQPNDTETTTCFDTLPIDKNYVRMCKLQNCFRARLTGKPWRMNIADKPPVHTWKISAELSSTEKTRVTQRKEWLEYYITTAKNYKSCEFLMCVGNVNISVHNKVADIIKLHDELCQCGQDLPMA